MMWSGKRFLDWRGAASAALLLALCACSQLPPALKAAPLAAGPVLTAANHLSRPVMRSRTLSPEALAQIHTLYIDPDNCPAPQWQADRNNTLFVLRNALMQRGYRFTDQLTEAQATLRLHYRGMIASESLNPGRALLTRHAAFDQAPSTNVCESNGESVLPLHDSNENLAARIPVVRIELQHSDSQQLIWQGEAAGHHPSARPSLNSQLLLIGLSRQIPRAEHDLPLHAGMPLGIRFAIISADGEHFMPVITEVIANSPAARAGLRHGDPLLEIEKQSTLNRLVSEIIPLLHDSTANKLVSVQRELGDTPILVRTPQAIGMRHSP